MNIIKAIIVAALVLAFASLEAGAQGNLTIEKGQVAVRVKNFGEEKGILIFLHKDWYDQIVSKLEEDLKGIGLTLNNWFIKDHFVTTIVGGNAETACFEAYGLKDFKLEIISLMVRDRGYDHEVAKLLFVCKEEGE